MDQATELLGSVRPSLVALVVSYGTRVLGALFVLMIGFWIAGRVERVVRAVCERRGVDPTLSRFVEDLARYTVLVLVGVSALSTFGVETASFAAVLGSAGLAIGLALQGTLSNVAAGVMLILFRPFKVDDGVTIAGQTGRVEDISLFTVTLITPDNRVIILPNGAVFGTTIINTTEKPNRRCDVDISLAFRSDVEVTRAALQEALDAIGRKVPEPVSAVVMTGITESSVQWSVRCWVKQQDYGSVREELLIGVRKSLQRAGLDVPFSQGVHLSSAVR